MQAVPTRERLVTEAMRLFGEQGYRATSVAQIEAAAGLASGSGALYHHFKSKEALLDAGINRQLDRRRAMQDIRALFVGLGDLHAELTLLARYLLAVLDEESQLLQIASALPTGRPPRLDDAYAALFESLYTELAQWAKSWVPEITDQQSMTLAVVAVNSLFGNRATTTLLHTPVTDMPDEQYIAEWTAMLANRIEALRKS
ncbi:TetR/AcrR family transcriptional regulator [Mycobacterium bourgelatii]|uniref:Putative transcriptional regulator, TetR family protein n=1 Tax=Mycobacterium bourgelatii TaxID=1273442 RepID=A0A7I9YSZ0_MYCBU|nr:TetR/AcrR family transcriptional regulator [Mycobacterium bourgelatii]MCV6977291.1 TetR/AcrR family transcriptional regulator [Mycobacterium bourgelatii]GFG91811.1 putative transcriptional regulator, TetR family protein [Mycobacterium bourgelatii]